MKVVKDPQAAESVVDSVPFFKAFCNETRAQIIDFLLGGERCVCEMSGPLDLSQPLVSHHLAFLRDAGLVRLRGEGARTYYSINWEHFDAGLNGFLDYVERRRCAAPDFERTESACAAPAAKPAQLSASGRSGQGAHQPDARVPTPTASADTHGFGVRAAPLGGANSAGDPWEDDEEARREQRRHDEEESQHGPRERNDQRRQDQDQRRDQ